MKTFALTLTACCALCALSYAGTEYSGKEMKQVAPAPCPEWYADNEWNVSIWGAYGFGGERNDTERRFNLVDGETVDVNEGVIGDDAWGGGMDIKYFFHRYFGIGVEGYGLATHRGAFDFRPGLNSIGLADDDGSDPVAAVQGTFTIRFPIRCTRFAPYIYGGGGVIFGPDRDHYVLIGVLERFRHTSDDGTQAIGQVGGGLEVRFTRHIGWINDVSWNFTEHDDFGLIRSGINFAF